MFQQQYFCLCCKSNFNKFLDYKNRKNALCPQCNSLERHRLIYLFLKRHTNFFSTKQTIIHFAPEKSLRQNFARQENIQYITADLLSDNVDLKIDITNLPLKSKSVDVIICSYVLEHVQDDKKALNELYRILKPDGWALLNAPVDFNRETTYEDKSITTEEEREKNFGQKDHVRVYGKDYISRLENAGFVITTFEGKDICDKTEMKKFGLLKYEKVFFCKKKRAPKYAYPYISVAVVTRNRAEKLLQCLNSLRNQTIKPKEVVVVDNNSKDNTKKIVDLFKKELPVKYYKELRVGIPYARNRAVKEARGEILAFIDDDCQASKNWVAEIINEFSIKREASAVQGKVVCSGSGVFSKLTEALHNVWLQNNIISHDNEIAVGDCRNFSVKIKDLIEANIHFDEEFYRGQDVDLVLQLINKNRKVFFASSVVVSHSERSNIFSYIKQKFEFGRSSKRYEKKWPLLLSSLQLKKKNNKKYLNEVHESILHLDIIKRIKVLSSYKFQEISFLLGRTYELLNGIKIHPPKGQEINMQSMNSFLTVSEVDKGKKIYKALKVSVGLIVKDDYTSLIRCIKSLETQSIEPFEIVVIDSSFSKNDRTIRKLKKNKKIVYIKENIAGYSYQRNKILEVASGELIAMLSIDCEASKTWIEDIIRSHLHFSKAVAIQGRSISVPRENILAALEQLRSDEWILNSLRDVNTINHLVTKNCSLKLKILKKYNIFFTETNDYNKFGGEDLDFAYKLLQKNLIVKYDPHILAFHHTRTKLKFFLDEIFQKGQNRALLDLHWGSFREKLIYKQQRKIKRILLLYNTLPNKNILFLFKLFVYYKIQKKINNDGYQNFLFLNKNYYIPFDTENRKVNQHVSLALILEKNNKNYVRNVLHTIFAQRVLPSRLLIFSKDDFLVPSSPIPIKYYSLPNTKDIKKIMLIACLDTKEKIIGFLSDSSHISQDWIENMESTHKQDRKAIAVTGFDNYNPRKKTFNLMRQFFYQTAVKDLTLTQLKPQVNVSPRGHNIFETHFFKATNVTIKRIHFLQMFVPEVTLHDKHLSDMIFLSGRKILFCSDAVCQIELKDNILLFLKDMWNLFGNYSHVDRYITMRKTDFIPIRFYKNFFSYFYFSYRNNLTYKYFIYFLIFLTAQMMYIIQLKRIKGTV